MKILVVDDEELIRNVIREYAVYDGFQVLEASDGVLAIDLVKRNKDIDLIVLDVMMPKMDGLKAYEEIKKIKNIPTIILSARGDEYDKLSGFSLGIDDYLTKPFSPKELMARIKAIMKRCNCSLEPCYIYESLCIDTKAHVVTLHGNVLDLTPKEYDLLLYFLKNKNVALSREQLLNKIWGYDFYGDDRTIDTHIKMLRNSLLDYRDHIVTVRGMGYKFVTKE